ncbi:MAG: permease-like cell division protein FtsX [Desulfovibrio sp.]|nr:permease-like cell division protein FtsX [Desulfovibrio sp.]
MLHVFIQLIVKGVRDLRTNPWAQGMTFAAVVLIALLGGMFLLVLHNLDQELLRVRGDVLFQIYWKQDADLKAVQTQWSDLKSLPGVQDMITFTPDQALKDLASRLGKDVDLRFIKDKNPLPATAMLSFARADGGEGEQGWIDETKAYLEQLPGVATVRYNPMRTELVRAWGTLSDRVVLPLIGFLLVVLGLVVGNTIKLSLLTRADEIEIMRIVGAREWYIRLPFVAGGVAQGFAGSVTALILLKIVQLLLQNVFNFPPLFFQFRYLPFSQMLLLVLTLSGVGLLGSWLAVRRAHS